MLTLLWALVPSAGCLWLFWLALRAMLQADRRERAAIAQWEAEQDRAAAAAAAGSASPADGDPAPGDDVTAAAAPAGADDATDGATR